MMDAAALYIHFPFCKRKCNYCDFYSVTQLAHQDEFIDALLAEIDNYAKDKRFRSIQFTTLYFGGGTPSLLSPPNLNKILDKINTCFSLAKDAEISLEANPGTIVDDRLADFRQSGVNRLTFGVQSFIDSELQTLSRIHSAQHAVESIERAQKAGFENIGLDLIFAIPGQTMHSLCQSLQQAVNMGVQHISAYGLTFEANTPITHLRDTSKIAQLPEELETEMFLFVHEFLQNAGFEHYEISNYAQPKKRSQHNQKYWDGSAYLGLGPSAHSFCRHQRWWNVSDLHDYVHQIKKNRLPVQAVEEITQPEAMDEMIMLGLRRREGIDVRLWKERFKTDIIELIQEKKPEWLADVPAFEISPLQNLLSYTDGNLSLTLNGVLLYDFVCKEFMSVF